MSSKSISPQKDEQPPRRVHAKRRIKSRACASPGRGPLNNGLMTAAWPKTPTYRAAKADSARNQRWSLGERVSRLSDQVEEMEVDSHETSVMLSYGASAEFNIMKTKLGTNQKKSNPILSNSDRIVPKSTNQSSKEEKTVVRHISEPAATKPADVVYKTTRKSLPIDLENLSSKEINVTSKPSTAEQVERIPAKSQKLPPLFIVLHVGKIDFGLVTGPATGPVKIFAERIMVQMENEVTKEDLSFRILCSDIKELEASLECQPFLLKFKVNGVQYTSQKKTKTANEKNNSSVETIMFHLAYESEVPHDVKQDLRELFQKRMADLNLWKEISRSTRRTSPLIEGNHRSPVEKRKLDENEIRKKDKEDIAGASSRKRTPVKQENEKVTSLPTDDVKVARRALFSEADDYLERIRNLENEAAQYQFKLGHKRLEVQNLEQRLAEKERDFVTEKQKAEDEIAQRDRDIVQLRIQVETLKLQINLEKEVTSTQRQQITELQRALAEKSIAVEEQQQAILVRDNQLKEVRAIATSPSKLNESELRERAKRLENSLHRTRSTLDETRRSKSTLSDELRRNVDLLANLREQLRCEVSRGRGFQAEASAATKQINELVGAKRALQLQLNDERETVATLERERLIVHRRMEEEANLHVDAEAERARLILSIEEKDRLLEEVRAERDRAVTEVGILKREMHNLNEQTEESGATALTARDTDMESHDWIIDRNEVIIHNVVLGTGGWGQVKLGKFRGTDVAVKQIHQLILSPHNRRLFNREMTIASRCRHPCLLQFIGATSDDGIPLFLSELMETDLRSHLIQQPLRDAEVLTVGRDVALALNYLHKQRPLPIIHRDISSANVLIWHKGQEMHGKLSDYGAANFMRISMTKHPGACLYSAPETASREQTTKVDVYSFGVLFCEMVIRELPVVQQRVQQISLIQKPEQRNLVLRCVENDPELRPDADEIIELLSRWRSM